MCGPLLCALTNTAPDPFSFSVPTISDYTNAFNNVSDIDSNTNTLEQAARRIGPIRGWFTRGATVYFLTCGGSDLAGPFAEAVLRDSASAYGNEHILGVNKTPPNPVKAAVDVNDNDKIDGSEVWDTDLDDFLTQSGWMPFVGGL